MVTVLLALIVVLLAVANVLLFVIAQELDHINLNTTFIRPANRVDYTKPYYEYKTCRKEEK